VFKSAICRFVVGKPCAVIRGSAHPTSVAKLTHSETGAAAGGFHLGSFLEGVHLRKLSSVSSNKDLKLDDQFGDCRGKAFEAFFCALHKDPL
jgi:hypothetical protein